MKRQSKAIFLLLALGAVFFAACGKKENGQLVGAKNRPKWKGINPYGMVYVPSGSFQMGPADQDAANIQLNRPRTVSINGFFMDDTEITNNEYRQFTEWVRDSLAHALLDHYEENEDGTQSMLWKEKIDWTDEALNDLFYQGNDRFNGKKEFNVEKMVVEYDEYDWQGAAHDHGKSKRNSFIKKYKTNIYPDTLAWIRDFAYAYNEPMTRNYYSHPAYDDYPVVGVNWKMANAFCWWRTKLWNQYRSKNEPNSENFRLPSEGEWEYAARGGHESVPYPWGGPYTRNSKGCLLANFKPGRGNYAEDGGQYTVKADAYFPNDYGLYNMAGNVSEWTLSAYTDNTGALHDLNPHYTYDAKDDEPIANKRKVVRGGSWKDVAYYMQTGTRSVEYQDTTKSYVGFRCALTFLGRSMNDF